MTEFKAPPPPPADFVNEPTPVAAPEAAVATEPGVTPETVVTAETEVAQDVPKKDFKKLVISSRDEVVNTMRTSKSMWVVTGLMFVLGLIFGAILFGGSSSAPAPIIKGLQGVVANPDISPELELKRCGQEREASKACVLYVMNYATYDKLARDFFETAVVATGRSSMLIGVDNVRYAGVKIPPGYFAQIKIPAYK